MSRDQALADAFVELADTLVDDFDVIEFLHLLALRCVDLLGVDAAGIMMADQTGILRVLAASTEDARLVELYELQHDEGPCVDAFRSGAAVNITGQESMTARWPGFTPRLRDLGFQSVQAIPLRLRRETVGALNLFSAGAVGLTDELMRLGQALADVATIGLLQERSIVSGEHAGEQLQTALRSHVGVEQAKGVLGERAGITFDEAFHLIRDYAQRTGRKLSEVAHEVTAGTVALSKLLGMEPGIRTQRAEPGPEPRQAGFERGQLAYVAGNDLISCPYGHEQQALRKAWVRGWLHRMGTDPSQGKA